MSALSSRSIRITGVLGAAVLGAVAVLAFQAITAPAPVAASPVVDTVAVTAASTQPPKGARARIAVTPNPARPGDTVTISGDCGGGSTVKSIVGGIPGGFQALENVRILDPNPAAFRASATVGKVGAGVGPVFVECDGEAGVTLLVTQPAAR